MNSYNQIYTQMLLIRLFEERLLELFSEGKLFGTTHTYIGQESIAVTIINQLKDQDIIFTNHRCHGHYLARFDDPEGLLAEIMGKEKGICGGRGGSQHLYRQNFYSNGVQGGYFSIAAGIAFSQKQKKTGGIVVAFIGDGTLGEGSVYEGLNIASLKEVPLLIVVENNRYAQTTPLSLNMAGSMVKRFEAFGIETQEIESNDIDILLKNMGNIVERVQKESKPFVQIIHTYRLKAHSKGDDFRPIEEINVWEELDPLKTLALRIPNTARQEIESKVKERLLQVEQVVDELPFGTL
jgi:TPP-dependent pyruvate/acetoin dehydrogenase alpha subunit